MKKHIWTIFALTLTLNACGLQLLDSTNARNSVSSAVPGDDDDYTVGGTVVGLPLGKNIDVSVNDGSYTLDNNGDFTFPADFEFNDTYEVLVNVGPGGAYTCTVNQGEGIVQSNINNIVITCTCNPDSLGSGSGSETDPYLVYTAEQFNTTAITGGATVNSNKHFLQVCELNFEDVAAPTPFGTYAAPFNGVYDGGGFFISNYTSDGNAPTVMVDSSPVKGIFAYTLGAEIANVNLSNIDMVGSAAISGGKIGGLIAYASVTKLDNIYAENITINTDVGTYNAVGGLVGYNTYAQCEIPEQTPPATRIHVKNVTITRNNPNADAVDLNSNACHNGMMACNFGGVFGRVNTITQEIKASNVLIQGCDIFCGTFAGTYNPFQAVNSSISSFGEDLVVHDSRVEGGSFVGGMFGALLAVVERVSFDGSVLADRPGSRFVGGLAGLAYNKDDVIKDSIVSTDVAITTTNPDSVGFVAGSYINADNISYDAGLACPGCQIQAGFSAQTQIEAFYDGSDMAMQNWDTQNTWCLQSGAFADLRNVPFSSCL